tara:strand:+ start:8282 stop:11347 length:3066 start_codon:yes stop_codon:yes gene_type:complete
MALFIQPSFAKGELGPALYGRVDTAAYQVGLRTAMNAVIQTHGGVSNRAGLQFIAPCKDHTKPPVLIDFQFKATDTYVIEMGNLYMRFIRNDAQVLETLKTISNVTDVSDKATITSSTHGYVNGDHVYIDSIVGATELNGRWFIVSSKTTNTFELTDPYDSTTVILFASLTAYASGGKAGRVYEVTTPYAQADLAEIKWTQSADRLTVTHSNYGVREISRTDHNAWTISAPTFAPSVADPTAVAVTVNGADNNVLWKYKVTAIKDESFEESLSGINNAGKTVASATAANPVVVTITGHQVETGDEVELVGFTEMTEVNDRRFIVTKVNADTFQLDGEDGSGYDAESTGGSNTCFATYATSGTVSSPTGTTIPDNTITWAAVSGAIKYTVYRAKGGREDYGLLAETSELTYTDDTAALTTTDLSITPPTARNPFRVATQFPGAVGYYQQRRVFGGSSAKPDTSYFSQTGNQSNFTHSSPTQADDAITATLNSRKVNQIRHYVPGKDLIALTDGSEWRINSGDNSGFSAASLKQEPQTFNGANHLIPAVANQTILYVQENNIAVRSIGYQLNIDGYTGTDLTLLASHIFAEHTAVSWGFARSPDPVAHIVRSDGKVAVMTYNEDQEVLAWAQWETRNGLFKWATALRPSSAQVDDAPYFVVERVIDGNTVLFLERIASRRFSNIQDAFFVDSGLSLDVPFAISAATAADPVVLTTAAHGFSNGDEIDVEGIEWTPQYDTHESETNPDQLNDRRYFVLDKGSTTLTLGESEVVSNITAITQANPGVVTSTGHGLANGELIYLHGIAGMVEANNHVYQVAGRTADTFQIKTAADANVNTSGFTAYTNSGSIRHVVNGSAFKAYVRNGNVRKAVTTISGLNHLEGQQVAILSNGDVVTGKTVTAGAITLDRKASRVHVGLNMTADFETLNIEAPSGTIQGRPTKISNVTVRFEKSRGLLIGPDSSNMVEMKQRENEAMSTPTALFTGDKEITLKPSWNSNGRFYMRQPYPLPVTILAVIPDIVLGS